MDIIPGYGVQEYRAVRVKDYELSIHKNYRYDVLMPLRKAFPVTCHES